MELVHVKLSHLSTRSCPRVLHPFHRDLSRTQQQFPFAMMTGEHTMYSIMSINMRSTIQDANIICEKSTSYITSISYQHYININLSPSIKLHIYKKYSNIHPNISLALLKTIPFPKKLQLSQACLGSIKGHPPFEGIQAASTGPNVGTVRTQNARP